MTNNTEDLKYRLTKYTAHFLRTFSRMFKLWEPDDEMIEVYVKKFSNVHISHLVCAFEVCYEKFKDAGRYPSPDEILQHAADEKRLIVNQQSGPMQVSAANAKMLEIFIRAFRTSGLKGKDLENHLLQVVEENYDFLGCKPPRLNCQRCSDKGYLMAWFVRFAGLRDVHQKSADGKSRNYFELNRVPNAPIWIQDECPDFDAPEGQFLDCGLIRCECASGERWSFPVIAEQSSLPL